jgi:hypothetical protein
MSSEPITQPEADAHKQHFACFACRKSFKPRGTEMIGTEPDRDYPCPDCRQPMTLVGRDFQAPPVRATKQWQLLELLRSFGVIFEPGLKQPKSPPQTLSDAETFLIAQGYDDVTVRKRLDQIRTVRQEVPRATRAEKKQQESRRAGRGR